MPFKLLHRRAARFKLHLQWVKLIFRFGPKSPSELKYFCIYVSNLGLNGDCLDFALNPNLRPSVGNMLLRKVNVAAAFKGDVIIRSVNKTAQKCNAMSTFQSCEP